MRGTSEKFSGNWVKRKLSRGRARPVTPPPAPTSTRPPPAPGSGRRDFSGYRRRRGGGERKTCHSRLSASPPRTPARRAAWSQAVPAPAPAQAGGRQVAGTRGAQPPARDAPSPRSRPAGPAAPRRSPAIRELAQDTNATRVPAGDGPALLPRVRSAGQQSAQPPLVLSVRQRRRRRETGCARPRPPLRPPRQWKTPGLAALTHARPPARPPGSPAPEASPPPARSPAQRPRGLPADSDPARAPRPPCALGCPSPSPSRSFLKLPTLPAGIAGSQRSLPRQTAPVRG
ncbi:atherin-like [Ursus maritimus]|uniref:Atherin-like n=1 Tax=Ursus maritimus TaxID=29073 RepID=A0A8M1GLE5_URSMA|nr:atherin-like [Ursus maritimus]